MMVSLTCRGVQGTKVSPAQRAVIVLLGKLHTFLTAVSQAWTAGKLVRQLFEFLATVVTLSGHLVNTDADWTEMI